MIERHRADEGVAKLELVRRVEQSDGGFTPSQYWRILAGRSTWTLDRFVYAAEALGLDPPMLLDQILAMLRERDGPEDADGATPTSSGPGGNGGSHPAVPGRSAAEPDGDD